MSFLGICSKRPALYVSTMQPLLCPAVDLNLDTMLMAARLAQVLHDFTMRGTGTASSHVTEPLSTGPRLWQGLLVPLLRLL